ncbi:hypothetical protein BpHYR1_007865 [Brachionus plicatilis]|uniref:Uncharacterized protein n=1 Tax=Brachionus plicatilis TaxID=10195 RepID=A0A3M7SU57_BRAPC|nr:hypothetical protein BpHYR1_007865 [Brachionus plicatilis]
MITCVSDTHELKKGVCITPLISNHPFVRRLTETVQTYEQAIFFCKCKVCTKNIQSETFNLVKFEIPAIFKYCICIAKTPLKESQNN